MGKTTYLIAGPALMVALIMAVTWVLLPAVCRLMGWM